MNFNISATLVLLKDKANFVRFLLPGAGRKSWTQSANVNWKLIVKVKKIFLVLAVVLWLRLRNAIRKADKKVE